MSVISNGWAIKSICGPYAKNYAEELFSRFHTNG